MDGRGEQDGHGRHVQNLDETCSVDHGFLRLKIQANAKCAVALVSVAVALKCGCSDQKALARRLSEADRAIVSDQYDSKVKMALSAHEAKKLVAAISTSQKESPFIEAVMELRIEFFKETNLLGVISVGRMSNQNKTGVFSADRHPYSEKTGSLQAVVNKFIMEQTARRATNSLAP